MPGETMGSRRAGAQLKLTASCSAQLSEHQTERLSASVQGQLKLKQTKIQP